MAGTDTKSHARVVISHGRQMGKTKVSDLLRNYYASMKPTKIIWYELPGRKLKATWEVGPRGWENYGLKESDIDPIQQWCTQNRCGKRISFDTFIFKEDKQITMFLLRWSS